MSERARLRYDGAGTHQLTSVLQCGGVKNTHIHSSGAPLRSTGWECFAHVYRDNVIGSVLVVYSACLAYKFVALMANNIKRRTETLNPPPPPSPLVRQGHSLIPFPK